MFLCLCKALTEQDVRRAARTCPLDADCLAHTLGLNDQDCCGRCVGKIEEFLSVAAGPVACHTTIGTPKS